jgi:hypothetical protein
MVPRPTAATDPVWAKTSYPEPSISAIQTTTYRPSDAIAASGYQFRPAVSITTLHSYPDSSPAPVQNWPPTRQPLPLGSWQSHAMRKSLSPFDAMQGRP